MYKKDDIPVFPVIGWHAGPLPGHDAVIMKFQFLSSPMQPIETAQETQFFSLTPDMAESLVSYLQRHIESLRNHDVGSPFKGIH
ncbi:bssS family protein [Atlantibacter hermannii]|uniref:bssS family protein n=1 Tax=Atlantibacter hermannii TaxID=565 RepID=UPI0028965377|nr:bssS family protein [Atlantibacter hermannii]